MTTPSWSSGLSETRLALNHLESCLAEIEDFLEKTASVLHERYLADIQEAEQVARYARPGSGEDSLSQSFTFSMNMTSKMLSSHFVFFGPRNHLTGLGPRSSRLSASWQTRRPWYFGHQKALCY